MNRLAAILFLGVLPLLHGGEIALPAPLPAYEKYVVARIAAGLPPSSQDKVRLIVAAGESETVQHQEEVELSRGSTARDAADYWLKKHGSPLLGWPQGLVVIRRKVGDEVTRTTWSMRQSRTEAVKFELRNGDVLIGLVYGDI